MKPINSTQIVNEAFFSPSDETLELMERNPELASACLAHSLILWCYCEEILDTQEDFDLFDTLGNMFKP